MAISTDPVALARDLVRCPSVTPQEGGALALLGTTLARLGFEVHRQIFREDGTPDVENLYARVGTGAPHLVFAGHTDVVPAGEPSAWRHPPFSGEIVDGALYGRGAVDMKGAIASFVAAAAGHLNAHEGRSKGAISLLITGDEEGPGVNGTVKLLRWAAARGETFDHCIVGEPSNPERLGDMIKIGRRGSLSGTLTVTGRQGHAAYPHLANNPIPHLLRAMTALLGEPLDRGNAHFDPSNLEFTSVDVGNAATNVIPREARARFNIRFNDIHTQDSLKAWIAARCEAALGGAAEFRLDYALGNSSAFITKPGPFVAIVSDAVESVTGRRPALSTSGGTSDARFIKDYCPVIEFGLVGQTMHQTDEHVATTDLAALTAIYRAVLDRYFA
jgi:succinyl-diaminopimelate desuccinylase